MAPQAGAELHPGDPRLSAAELLGGARRARERERAQGAAATVERITVGRWLAALHARCAFPQEGAATFAAWVEEHLEFSAQMARRCQRAGPHRT